MLPSSRAAVVLLTGLAWPLLRLAPTAPRRPVPTGVDDGGVPDSRDPHVLVIQLHVERGKMRLMIVTGPPSGPAVFRPYPAPPLDGGRWALPLPGRLIGGRVRRSPPGEETAPVWGGV